MQRKIFCKIRSQFAGLGPKLLVRYALRKSQGSHVQTPISIGGFFMR